MILWVQVFLSHLTRSTYTFYRHISGLREIHVISWYKVNICVFIRVFRLCIIWRLLWCSQSYWVAGWRRWSGRRTEDGHTAVTLYVHSHTHTARRTRKPHTLTTIYSAVKWGRMAQGARLSSGLFSLAAREHLTADCRACWWLPVKVIRGARDSVLSHWVVHPDSTRIISCLL